MFTCQSYVCAFHWRVKCNFWSMWMLLLFRLCLFDDITCHWKWNNTLNTSTIYHSVIMYKVVWFVHVISFEISVISNYCYKAFCFSISLYFKEANMHHMSLFLLNFKFYRGFICSTSTLPAFFVFGKAPINTLNCIENLLSYASTVDKPVMVWSWTYIILNFLQLDRREGVVCVCVDWGWGGGD